MDRSWKATGFPAKEQKKMETIDPLYVQVLRFVIENQKLSMRDIKKKFHLAYNAAGRIVVWMEEKGYITPYYSGEDEKPREFLTTLEQIDAIYGQDN